MQAYQTVATDASIELIINKSKFIGYAFALNGQGQNTLAQDAEALALQQLANIRKRHYDATHNCYAYIAGTDGQTARFSDDGEPSGTAGMPILEVLRHKSLVNVLVVVTRYFGGVLLGAGGLVRAYTKACTQAVDAAGSLTLQRTCIYALEVEYGLWDKVQYLMRTCDVPLHSVEYGSCVALKVRIVAGQEAPFVQQLTQLSGGKRTLDLVDEVFM